MLVVGSSQSHTRINVAIVTLIFIKVLLYILYYRICSCSIRLKRTVIMWRLWLSSPALGSCIPNLGYFLASSTYSELTIWKYPFMGQEITPLDIWQTNISARSPVTAKILFYQVQPFLALILNLGHFDNFSPAST